MALKKTRRGGATIEYALIAALIVVAAVAIYSVARGVFGNNARSQSELNADADILRELLAGKPICYDDYTSKRMEWHGNEGDRIAQKLGISREDLDRALDTRNIHVVLWTANVKPATKPAGQ